MRSLGSIVALLAAATGAYLLLYPTTYYRFRITVEVETPQGLKSGSSVLEATTRRYPAWTTLGNNTGETSLKGEAVFVDLGKDGSGRPQNLVALLTRGSRGENVDFYLVPGKAFEPLWKEKTTKADYRGQAEEIARLPAGTRTELTGDLIPTLVTFASLDDQKTVSVISPNQFAGAFGRGVRLESVTIEIVPSGVWPLNVFGISGTPLTHQIEAKMPEIIRQLREQARVMQVRAVGSPYAPRLGHLIGG